MNNKFLGITLAASMLMTSAPSVVFADTMEEAVSDVAVEMTDQEQPTEETAQPAEEVSVPEETEGPEEAVEEIFGQEETTMAPAEEAAQEEDGLESYRDGTTVNCSLTLDNKVDGEITDVLEYDLAKESYEVQLGGQLNLQNVWNKYSFFKTAYILKNGKEQFLSKALKGEFSYSFRINTDVVTVSQDILCSPEAWQTAFEEGSGAKASTFFSYMRCSEVTYDETTGVVSVRFTINENGTGKVSMVTMESGEAARPRTIEAYSPAGAMVIEKENFRKGETVIYSDVQFSGDIDLDPWMALVFPIHFDTSISQSLLSLDIPNASVTFLVENGTWADGSEEAVTVSVPLDFAEANGQRVLAGTLETVPTGMKAAIGFDQASGTWDREPVQEENGFILPEGSGYETSYTYSFAPVMTVMVPVYFHVENGTWADGTTDVAQAQVPMTKTALMDEEGNQTGYVLTGTISEDLLPSGMIAAEGFDQASGRWSDELCTEENGFVIPASRAASAHFTYTFDKKSEPAQPGEEGTDPGEEEKPGDTTKPADTDKDSSEPAKKPIGSDSSSKVPTAAAAGAAGLAALQTAAAGAVIALIRRRKK